MAHEKAVWFCKIDGSAVGPLTAKQLRQLALDGDLKRDGLVRRGDRDTWVVADRVKGLFDVPEPGPTRPKGTTPGESQDKSNQICTAEIVPEQKLPTNSSQLAKKQDENAMLKTDTSRQRRSKLLSPSWTLVAIASFAISAVGLVVATVCVHTARNELSREVARMDYQFPLGVCTMITLSFAVRCITNCDDELAMLLKSVPEHWTRHLRRKPRLGVESQRLQQANKSPNATQRPSSLGAQYISLVQCGSQLGRLCMLLTVIFFVFGMKLTLSIDSVRGLTPGQAASRLGILAVTYLLIVIVFIGLETLLLYIGLTLCKCLPGEHSKAAACNVDAFTLMLLTRTCVAVTVHSLAPEHGLYSGMVAAAFVVLVIVAIGGAALIYVIYLKVTAERGVLLALFVQGSLLTLAVALVYLFSSTLHIRFVNMMAGVTFNFALAPPLFHEYVTLSP